MPNIQRGTIAEDFRNGLDLDSARTGKYPNEASEKVVLTYDYSNAAYISKTSALRNSDNSGATIFTTNNDRDTLIYGVTLSLCKDATSTATEYAVRVPIGGVVSYLVVINGLTLNALNQTISVTFPTPVKVDKNAIVAVASTGYGGGAGHLIYSAVVHYRELI